uniref:G-protein coupled receptors family 1 profile domain-containing protein n=1 Tax=Plectus sambesii TaxID=2011161 RepID=A0A914X734_9BILA
MSAVNVTLSAVSLVGLIGNLYLLRRCSRSPKQRKKHTFFLNQALIGSLSALTMQISCLALMCGTRLTGLAESAHHFLSSWLAIASIYQLVAMSLKRCLMVWRPFLERQVQLWHKAIGVVFVYTISAAIIIPLALDSSQSAVPFIASGSIYPVIAYWPNSRPLFCLVTWLAVPLFIMIVCYGIILHVVIRTANQDHQRKISNSRRPIVPRIKGKKRRMLRRVCFSMLTVIGAFIFLWAPYVSVATGWNLFRSQQRWHDERSQYPPEDLMTVLTVLAQTFVVFNAFLCGFEGYRTVLRPKGESTSLPTSFVPSHRQLRIACNRLTLSPSVTASARGQRSSDRSTADVSCNV